MFKIYLIIFLFLINFKVNSKNIFEIAAFSAIIPILYDQYFDNSLQEKTDFQKKQDVLKAFSDANQKTYNFEISPKSRSDLIYYLDILEKIN